ncbi:MAG: sulfotransferase domain-containing protein [Chloroflexi bacterium]|nr:sulfotransferase domain-containing protein [Chloroflexota bacterium]MCI0645869.1 sulfotransferase domain-containing protein [Chloroflexota bacterium]MCI0725724.1 sulfotransferase domain-containing protein [Chloroflexota bacterium]
MPVIVCNGMNRAGSTLQYNLVRGLVEKMGLGQGEGFILREQIHDCQTLLQAWGQDGRWHVVKMHDLPPGAAEMTAAGTMVIGYIYRDIRGVAASYKRVWQFEGEKLLEELDRAVATYYAVGRLPQHVLWQKYEEVMADLPQAARELAAFLNLAPSPALLDEVVRECSVDSMKKVLQRLEWKLRLQKFLSLARRSLRRLGIAVARPQTQPGTKQRIDQQTLLHPNHISANGGAPDNWQSLLSESEKEWLTARYGQWLQEAGYPADTVAQVAK